MKQIIDLIVTHAEPQGAAATLLRLRPQAGHLPPCRPGQFAQLRADAPGVLLRRPISIHDAQGDDIAFLVQPVGPGTRWLATRKPGDRINALLPLGNGFSLPSADSPSAPSVLLVGGGVGVAPLYYQGRRLREHGIPFAFLLGARSGSHLLRLDAFRALGPTHVTTEDGSEGLQGLVTQHPTWHTSPQPTLVQTCGPMPMMRAVARMARQRGIPCEVSLENHMACGVGACLCCVTPTRDGRNRCVCTEGPVFDAERLEIES